MQDLYVKARGQHCVPIECKAKGAAVEWEFKTQDHDIGFAVEFVPAQYAGMALPQDFTPETVPDSPPPVGEPPETPHKSARKSVVLAHTIHIVPNTRVKADAALQYGSFTATEPGLLTIIWDNTYSTFRGKNLQYKIHIINDPSSNQPVIGNGVCRRTPYGLGYIEGRREDGMYVVKLPYGQGYFPYETFLPNDEKTPILTVNERALIGIDMFFNNRIVEAEAFFAPEMNKHPIFSLAYASMGFLRALMTWEKKDIEEAADRLKETRKFVAAFTPQESTMSSVKSFFVRSKEKPLTPVELESLLIQAETYILTAILNFTEESFVAYMKAGLKVRSSWKMYERCYKQITSEGSLDNLDNSVKGGIQFGVGTFNVMISIMPTIILKIVSAMGFPSDRQLGLSLIHECFRGGGVRSGLSALELLSIHVVVPSFFSVRTKYHLVHSQRMFDKIFMKYPNGAFFLWMKGRADRMKRDLDGATNCFQRAADAQPDWQQLQQLCAYELGFCHLFKHDYIRAEECFERLARETSWSKAFFYYTAACCALQRIEDMERLGTASAHAAEIEILFTKVKDNMSKIHDATQRKFGGRMLSIEQYVNRRAEAYLKENKRPILPTTEIIYFFYGFIQMSPAQIALTQSMLDWKLKQHATTPFRSDDASVLHLIQAALLKQQGIEQQQQAQTILEQLDGAKQEETKDETYVIPFARYELASLWMQQVVDRDEIIYPGSLDAIPDGNELKPPSIQQLMASCTISQPDKDEWESERLIVLQKAHQMFKKAESYKPDFNLKNRLHFRIHLAAVEAKLLQVHWQDKGGNVQDTSAAALDAVDNLTDEERSMQAAMQTQIHATNDDIEAADD